MKYHVLTIIIVIAADIHVVGVEQFTIREIVDGSAQPPSRHPLPDRLVLEFPLMDRMVALQLRRNTYLADNVSIIVKRKRSTLQMEDRGTQANIRYS